MKIPKLSLVLMLLIFATLAGQYLLIVKLSHKSLSEAISDTTQASNATATQLFINEAYPRLSPYLGFEGGNTQPTKGLDGPGFAETDRIIRNFMLGTDIMKVKLYALNGMTVYSSEAKQIGEDKSTNPGFLSATQGIAGSQITHRGTFSSFDGEVFEKDLVASYIPIRNKSGIIIGVAEIYTDRTPAIEQSGDRQGNVHAYLLLFQALIAVLTIFLGWSFWSRIIQLGADVNPESMP